MFLKENTYSQNWIWIGVKSQLTVRQRDASKILIDRGRVGAWDRESWTWILIYSRNLCWVFFNLLLFIGVFLGYCGVSSKIGSLTWFTWVTIPWSLTEGTFLDSALSGCVVWLSTIETELFLVASVLLFF